MFEEQSAFREGGQKGRVNKVYNWKVAVSFSLFIQSSFYSHLDAFKSQSGNLGKGPRFQSQKTG